MDKITQKYLLNVKDNSINSKKNADLVNQQQYQQKDLNFLSSTKPPAITAKVSDDIYLQLYNECIQKINSFYLSDTIAFIDNNYKNLSDELTLIGNKIDDLWGKDLDQFKIALFEYYNLNLKLVNIFKKGVKKL